MDISAISASLMTPQAPSETGVAGESEAAQTVEAARQFESVLLRQFLNESMKGLLQGEGSGGGVYSYLLTDSLADSLSQGGGLGLSSVLQAQLSKGAK